MITTEIFPESLKIAKITPIYKKGEPTDLSNYRLISLLPTISKMFERIVHIQLQEYFNSNNLLAEQQYGFCQNHSTEYTATKLVNHISNTMDGHKIPGTIFIDLSKTFDTLSYDNLLYKLKFYSISGLEHKLIASYLSNRKEYVIFHKNSEFTEIRTIEHFLCPLLFSMSIIICFLMCVVYCLFYFVYNLCMLYISIFCIFCRFFCLLTIKIFFPPKNMI